MKKIKRIFSALAAITMTAVCTVSAFAQNPYDIIDVSRNDMKLVISNETSTGRNELWIDDTYRYLTARLFKTTVAIRMTDGTEPPSPADSNSAVIQKLTNVQKVNMMSVESVWFMDADDIKLSDDLYVVKGFTTAEAAEEYCQALIADGKADYAEPIVTGEYSYCYPAQESLLDYFKNTGIGYDESKLEEINAFSKNLFVFCVSCKDETATIEYLKENAEGFEECVSVASNNGSAIYFQFKDSADDETKTNVLTQMCNLENISQPFIPVYSQLTNIPGTQVNAIPENYKSGDVNMDEKINLYDAIEVAKYIMHTRAFNDKENVLADYDDNGEVNLYDAVGVAKTLM